MGCAKNWKEQLRRALYCRRELNRKLLCLKHSMDEVCKILNTGSCHKL